MRVHLSKDLEELVKELVASGCYPTEKEAIAQALLLLRDRDLLRKARRKHFKALIRAADESAKEEGWLQADEVFEWVNAEGRRQLPGARDWEKLFRE